MLGLRFCARAFSSCGERGPLLIAVRGPLTVAAFLVAEHRLQTRRLSSCGSRVQPLCGMWDPPRPGLEPMSPALAGRFPTTAPPGKPLSYTFYSYCFGLWFQKLCYLLFVNKCIINFRQNSSWGLPWWRSGWESACQCRGHGFEPWSGKIPRAAERLGPWATIAEPARLEPVRGNERPRWWEARAPRWRVAPACHN